MWGTDVGTHGTFSLCLAIPRQVVYHTICIRERKLIPCRGHNRNTSLEHRKKEKKRRVNTEQSFRILLLVFTISITYKGHEYNRR